MDNFTKCTSHGTHGTQSLAGLRHGTSHGTQSWLFMGEIFNLGLEVGPTLGIPSGNQNLCKVEIFKNCKNI